MASMSEREHPSKVRDRYLREIEATDKILRMPELMAITGLCRESLWRLGKSGELKFIKLTRHAVGVRRSELTRWLDSREVVS